ncbi:hypothetical protein L9F63_002030, partial [Diploptera punctata]
MDAGLKKSINPNPKLTANPLSIVTFWWVLDIFKKGYKKDLELDDLYDALDEHSSGHLGDKLERLWAQELEYANGRGERASLLRVLIKCYGPHAMFLGLVLAFTELCLQMTQPLFLGGLIRHFTPNSDVSREMAFIYAAAIIVCSTLNVFIMHLYCLSVFHTGMKMRVGLCSLIYRKALRLSKTALGETTVGQTVNLLSNDVSRFDVMLLFLSYMWVGPIEMAILTYFMWQQIEMAALIGVAIIALVIPIQAFIGKMMSTLRLKTAKRTDRRIMFMNEIIVGIQVIKMYAWEKPFAHLVSLARKHEIKVVRTASYLRGFLLIFGRMIARKVAIFVSIVSYVLLFGQITPEKMFVVVAFFNILTEAMTDFLPLAITHFAEAFVSVKRIRAFLLHEEVANVAPWKVKEKHAMTCNGEKHKIEVDIIMNRIDEEKCSGDGHNVDKLTGIKVTNATAKWSEDLTDNTLTNINLIVRPSSLVAIIGPVGSGKTSLLHTILKELPLNSGSILVGGSISYASQEPWLFTGSVRKNILFGQPMDRIRYKQVVKVCALERDFQLFPHGDRTIVGERGTTLSGGQRARINLARAVYKKADIYLLDDPLSAVDTHVGRHLFEDCICDFLRDKTCLLVTHQVQYLHTVDTIVILNNGMIQAKGTYTELHESGLDFAKQLALEPEEHQAISETSIHRTHRMSESSTIVSMSSSELQIEAEMRARGSVSSRVYRAYCAAGGNCCITMLVFGVCLLAQIAISSGDYWMSYWSSIEEKRAQLNATSTNNETFQNVTIPETTSAWLPSRDTCIYIYTALIAATVILVLLSIICFFTMCMRASVRLHDAMFANITRATMWFFNNNPSGQILNRFSKDMGNVDEFLPQTLIDCVEIALSLLGVVFVVAIVNFWLLIPTVVMFCLFYLLRVYYVSTSRSVKRLEGITRSPVYSHLSATLQGMTTIRAFGAEEMLEKEFDGHQDLHSSAWFAFISSSRAFGLWLDSTCLLYIATVTLSFLFVGRDEFGGGVGLAITQSIGLIGMLQWGMRQSAELENHMTSLERILEYTHVESEPPLESAPGKKPNSLWPPKGEITFDKAALAYSKDDPPVLKGISFTVKSTEKVGIVGRTGAGKSSLITSLFRLVELCDGSIRIDGINIGTIGLHDLRSKISIIPQEPALFSGPLRDNLDPFSQYSDTVLWSALEEVDLKQAVEELPAGLSHKVSEGGSNFSVGQRQLLCLARAIIRNNKILVLDEATANVDPQTDELIQATIRCKFADCTVLTIAHRLHTVMDSDRIIVMDAGSVVSSLKNEPVSKSRRFHHQTTVYLFIEHSVLKTLMYE